MEFRCLKLLITFYWSCSSIARFHLDDTLKNQFCNKATLSFIGSLRDTQSEIGKIRKFSSRFSRSYRRITFVRRSFCITQFIES